MGGKRNTNLFSTVFGATKPNVEWRPQNEELGKLCKDKILQMAHFRGQKFADHSEDHFNDSRLLIKPSGVHFDWFHLLGCSVSFRYLLVMMYSEVLSCSPRVCHDLQELQMKSAICLGVREYTFRSSGWRKVINYLYWTRIRKRLPHRNKRHFEHSTSIETKRGSTFGSPFPSITEKHFSVSTADVVGLHNDGHVTTKHI